jgi:hypothetical protein
MHVGERLLQRWRFLTRTVRHLKEKLLLATLGVVFGVGGVELALRVSPLAESPEVRRFPVGARFDPVLGWSYRPKSRFTYVGKEFRNRIVINSKGLRDREYSYERPSGVFRVLVVGDSFTAGLEVGLSEVWHEILEGHLRTSLGPALAEVVAAGVQGWSTDQELLYYRHEGWKYRPDVVLLQFWPDDWTENDAELIRFMGGTAERRKPYFVVEQDGGLRLRDDRSVAERVHRGTLRSVKQMAWERSSAYRLFRGKMKALRANRVDGEADPFCYNARGVPLELMIYSPEPPVQFAKAWQLTTAIVDRFALETTSVGSDFAVVYFPAWRQVVPEAWRKAVECWPEVRFRQWDLDRPNRLLAEHLATRGVPYLDLTPYLRESQRAGHRLFFDYDVHLTVSGHRVVGDVVFMWMREVFGRVR